MPKMLPYTTSVDSTHETTQYLITDENGNKLFKLMINTTAPFNTSIFDKRFEEDVNHQTYMPEDAAFTISTLILAHMTTKKGQ